MAGRRQKGTGAATGERRPSRGEDSRHLRIVGVGVDVAEVQRFARMARRPTRLLVQVFTDQELAVCREAGRPAEQYAAAFVLKEAAFKALGHGWLDGAVSWPDIELLTPLDAVPVRLRLRGAAADAFRRLGGTGVLAAVTSSGPLVLGQVVFLGKGQVVSEVGG